MKYLRNVSVDQQQNEYCLKVKAKINSARIEERCRDGYVLHNDNLFKKATEQNSGCKFGLSRKQSTLTECIFVLFFLMHVLLRILKKDLDHFS